VTIEPHEHEDIEEVYYVLRGQGEVRIGKEGRSVSEGDAIYLPPRKTHTLRNTGTYPLRFVCIGAKIRR
jgi:mannose-6-phosphate isomerase-like protein (cupin superfamily)